jgi:hypothetical protein
MGRPKYSGNCRICGCHGPLTFEHVPPDAAFNDRAVVLASIEEFDRADLDYAKVRGKIEQRGRGAYTLCSKCNSLTGHWYGTAFVQWASQALQVMHLRLDSPEIYMPFFVFPARVIKQILCMFASQADGLAYQSHPSLRRFLLDPNNRELDPGLRIFMYLNVGRLFRSMGITALGDLQHHTTSLLAETSFPPFGYVLTIRSPPPDKRLVDITHFAYYRYNDWKDLWLRIPFLPVNTWVPGDYRTLDQVRRDVERNRGDS